jgi:hypothetical protein
MGTRLDRELVLLRESIYPFVARRGGRGSMLFDPTLHPRNRLGEFAKLIGNMRQSGATGPTAVFHRQPSLAGRASA